MTARDLFPDLSGPSKPDASPRDIFTEREGDGASAGDAAFRRIWTSGLYRLCCDPSPPRCRRILGSRHSKVLINLQYASLVTLLPFCLEK